jgi:5-methyltetrahydropteroyltriglutamate--homocysteine methyltransferase
VGRLTRHVPANHAPFRADHVGSLLRPPELLKAREDFSARRIDADELHGVENEAIREVVRKQEGVGLQSATDGELRRASWHMDFIYELGGINPAQDHMKVQFRNAEGTIEFSPAALHIEERVVLREPIFADAFGPSPPSAASSRPRTSSRPRPGGLGLVSRQAIGAPHVATAGRCGRHGPSTAR